MKHSCAVDVTVGVTYVIGTGINHVGIVAARDPDSVRGSARRAARLARDCATRRQE